MKRLVTIILITLFLYSSNIMFAHSGRTDSNNGHHNYINRGYHFHSDMPIVVEIIVVIVGLFFLLVCFISYLWLKYWWTESRYKMRC